MRLQVGICGVEKPAGALGTQGLKGVGNLGAAVIAGAGIAFDGLVRKDGALRVQNGPADDIFRGDQLDVLMLSTRCRMPTRPRHAPITSIIATLRRSSLSRTVAWMPT